MSKSRGRDVRCLGPGPEHFFYSECPSAHRICPRCTTKAHQERTGTTVHKVELSIRKAHHSRAT